MKTLHRYKKVFQNTLLPLICALFFVVSSTPPSLADTNLYATSHGYTGTLSWVVVDMTEQGVTGNGSSTYGNLCRTEMTVNFADCQDGTFYINFNSLNSNATFLCDQCELTSTSTNESNHLQANFEFHGQTTMTIVIYYYTSSTVPTLLYPTSWGGSWNRLAQSEIAVLNDINHSLAIYLYDSVNGVDYLGEIYQSIEEINSSVDEVETLLRSINTSTMYNIEAYQHAAWFYASKYDSQFPRWKYGLPYMNYSTSYNSSNYTASHGIRLATGYSYVMMFYSNKALSTSDITLYYNGTADISVSTIPINEINSQLYLMGIIFKNNRTGFSTFEVEFGQTFELYPLYFGLSNNIPDEIRALYGLEYDNTYTRLLQQIANGIGNISVEQITENQTNINTYNSSMTAINNVENTYYNYYTSQDNRLQSSNFFDIYLPNISSDPDLHYSIDTFNSIFTQVFSIDLIQWPLTITLLGVVLVIILG